MTDLRTMREVEVGSYTVRYGKQETQDRYDAAVIKDKSGMFNLSTDGPIADHEKKWVAIGKAIQEYEDAGEKE